MSKSIPAWARFLSARADMIDELHKDGATAKQIANHLSMCPSQVEMIRTRDRSTDWCMRGQPEPKKDLVAGCKVRLLHNKTKCPIPALTEGMFVRDSGRWALVQWNGLSEEQVLGIQWDSGLKQACWVLLAALEVL